MADLDAIPAAPRPVRLRAVLRHRWPLGVAGLAFALVGLLAVGVLGTLGIDVLPLRDDALDAECALAAGEVTAVADAGIHGPDGPTWRIGFRFRTAGGETVDGESFAPRAQHFSVGEGCVVEHLAHAPEVSRIRGTRRNPLGETWTRLVGLGFLPAIAVLLFWLRGAVQTRLVLSTGRLTLARIVGLHPIGGLVPPQQRVDYEFEDGRGRTVAGSHWIGRQTPLGARLGLGTSTAAVVHDEARPALSRLVHSSDFAP